MKVPVEWLQELIEVPDSTDQLADLLIGLGTGVESSDQGVLNLEISANRGDLLSIRGIAREIHAKTGSPIKERPAPNLEKSHPGLSVSVESAFVRRYTTAILRGVKVNPTKSDHVVRRLRLAGMRPVNNIVDCTNYIMLELGQPTHAFDLNKIRGKKMIVRMAKESETLITLDQIERKLPQGSYVIADGEGVIDLPGIMGGQNSAIDEETTDVVLQAAVFDAKIIRQTSKALGLVSEASYRYERQVDPGGCLDALACLAEMVKKEADGTMGGFLDINHSGPSAEIACSMAEIRRLIGRAYGQKEVIDILRRLGCKVRAEGDSLSVVVPTWRPDLTVPADVAEEVARIVGYDRIPPIPLKTFKSDDADFYIKTESLKEVLFDHGCTEVYTYSLLSEKDILEAGMTTKFAVEIINPLSEKLRFFRPSLIPGLLKLVAKNPAYNPIRIFEIGHVADNRDESVQLGIVFAGKGAATLSDLAKTLGLPVKEISDFERQAFKIRKNDVFIAYGPLKEALQSIEPRALTMPRRFAVKPPSRFPAVIRDISIIVDVTVKTDEIITAIAESSEFIHLVELFDEFTGNQIGAGKKSLAFHIHYQHPSRTMTTKEIDRLHQTVESLLTKKFAAKVR